MLRNLFTPGYLKSLVYVAAAMLIAISAHEFAHGLVSYKLGDPTPKRDGRLTLNPFKHLDLWGTICLIFFKVGWAKPVRINTAYYKNKKWGIIMVSLAGPIINYIMAFFSLIVCYLLVEKRMVIGIWFYYVAVFNIGLGTFNLIPIPPLDGSNVLMEICPTVATFYRRIGKYARIILAVCLFAGILSKPLNFISDAILEGMWELICRMFWQEKAFVL